MSNSAGTQPTSSLSRPQSTCNNHPLTPGSKGRRFLNAKETATYLGVNSRTVTRWAREGYLPAYPIGEGKRRLWRFLHHDLERWVLSRQAAHFPFDLLRIVGTLDASHRCSDQGRK